MMMMVVVMMVVRHVLRFDQLRRLSLRLRLGLRPPQPLDGVRYGG